MTSWGQFQMLEIELFKYATWKGFFLCCWRHLTPRPTSPLLISYYIPSQIHLPNKMTLCYDDSMIHCQLTPSCAKLLQQLAIFFLFSNRHFLLIALGQIFVHSLFYFRGRIGSRSDCQPFSSQCIHLLFSLWSSNLKSIRMGFECLTAIGLLLHACMPQVYFFHFQL